MRPLEQTEQVRSHQADCAAGAADALEVRPLGAGAPNTLLPVPQTSEWSPDSWRSRPAAQSVEYPDAAAASAAEQQLRSLPPLVTSWEIERLREEIAQAQAGTRFILQGGDCAETIADCKPELIANKLKILLQMSLVLVHALKKPVTRIGRFAGQYAKPRSSPTETRAVPGGAATLPSYFGDLFNRAEFTAQARTPDPMLMVRGYQHAALTLNFIRALTEGGFADLHHPEYWDLAFFKHASLAPQLRAEYERMTTNLADGLRFMEALGERTVDDLTRVEFFTSHEGLNLAYEAAQTRRVPRREGWYNLTTHMPWIGERTRQLDGAHVELFRGIRNPVGVKIGPSAAPQDVVDLCRVLNPGNETGRVVLIARMGAAKVRAKLPPLVAGVVESGARVLWMCDPMHGNPATTSAGVKTRSFDAILEELDAACGVFEQSGARLGGVHFELTGDDVTECIGGAAGVTEADLSLNYASVCDPRLNYQQALEMAFLLARRMGKGAA
ncbi:MAG: 3-deoxy-7-phosphoheptulonate synthase [Planctomycetes bacterium]|nr:3-deoxy-7-phosphoheptulonate synthase [Planctomycetota bacterium]